jgi:prepilin-type N-terminal cleavage/methylation domain-containing protein
VHHAPRAARSTFTLIELLVVVAIIAVLASILLPTLASARDTARTSRCISNQKQCTQGIMLYADDYREYPLENPLWSNLAADRYLVQPVTLCAGAAGTEGMYGVGFVYRGPGFNVVPGNTKLDAHFGSITMANSVLRGYSGYIYIPIYLRETDARLYQLGCPDAHFRGNKIYGATDGAYWPNFNYGTSIPGNVYSYTANHNRRTAMNFSRIDGSVRTVRYAPGSYFGTSVVATYSWAKQ